MHITFFGQLGLPQLKDRDGDSREHRVEALARELACEGHAVTVFGTKPYLTPGNYHGITLKHIPSLNPEKPGGWVYLIIGLFSLLWLQRPALWGEVRPAGRPDVIHVHTHRAALLLSLTRWFFRHTRIVWTIDILPASRVQKVLQPITYNLLPHLTTPSRTIQYRLLVEHGIRAAYIPDGYNEPVVPDIAVSHFGLKREQYTVALVGSPAARRRVTAVYKASKTKKKLVVLQEAVTPRVRRSLIASAAAVIIGDDSVSSTVLLEAMHSRRAIIAPALPRYQELLGTAGQYVAVKDKKGVTAALISTIKDTTAQTKWGTLAHSRASRHFTWPRLVEDYQTLYVPQARLAPLDSAQPKLTQALA